MGNVISNDKVPGDEGLSLSNGETCGGGTVCDEVQGKCVATQAGGGERE